MKVVDPASLLSLKNIYSAKVKLFNPQEKGENSLKDVIMLIIDENVLFMHIHASQAVFRTARFGLPDIQRLVICPNLPIAAIELDSETEKRI